MKLRMRRASGSITFNRIQHARRISLKRKQLKTSHSALRPGIRLGRRGSGVQIAPPRPKKNKPFISKARFWPLVGPGGSRLAFSGPGGSGYLQNHLQRHGVDPSGETVFCSYTCR